jgi:hypothetical protein
LHALAIAPTTLTQMHIERREVGDLRHGRGPVALQVPHATLDARLLLRLPDHAKQGRKRIVTAQRLVTIVELSLAADEQFRGDGPWIVPPHLVRHTLKERERLDHSMQDRLGLLARHCDDEGTVRVRPGHQQHRYELAAFGKVHMDVAEVTFDALAGLVVERDEGLRQPRLT